MTMYLVKTEAGTTMLSQRQQAYVRSPAGGYIRKAPEFLSEGDTVIFEKKYAKLGLDAVDETLESRDERYRKAKQLLFERNSQGVYVPKLRTHLLRGLGTARSLNEENLEAKILRKNGQDLSVASYRLGADAATERIAEYATTNQTEGVSWSTVVHWLRGDVVAPQNKQLLYALATIHPEFGHWAAAFRLDGEIAKAYKLYTTIRQSVMAYLAEPVQEGEERERKKAASGGIHIDEEIAIILDQFGDLIRHGFFETTVNGVEQLTGNRGKGAFNNGKNDPSLTKGVYIGGYPANVNVHDLDEIAGAFGEFIAAMLYYDPSTNERDHAPPGTTFPAYHDFIKSANERFQAETNMPAFKTPAELLGIIKNDAIQFGYTPRQILESMKRHTDRELDATHQSFVVQADATMSVEYQRTVASQLEHLAKAPPQEREFARQQRKAIKDHGERMVRDMRAQEHRTLMAAKRRLDELLETVIGGIEGHR